MKVALPAELTVIIPCFNEAKNVGIVIERLRSSLYGIDWEAIFVDDDSPDQTSRVVQDFAISDPRVRLIRRIGRKGLSSAVIEGILASCAPIVAVMDGDGQHDESILPKMVAAIRNDAADIVVASRHVIGGASSGLSNFWRHALSRGGNGLARCLVRVPITDPMSGFFAVRRSEFDAVAGHLRGSGFKILLELIFSLPKPIRLIEIPFVFRPRMAGESKLGSLVLFQFVGMLLERSTAGWIPGRFILFSFVGLIGVGVNLVVAELARRSGIRFEDSQIAGTLAAIVANFQLNNRLTYQDRRLRGLRMLGGFLFFLAGCSFGAFADIGVAKLLYDANGHWRQSGAAGAVIGVVWNYAVASTLVWR